MLSHLVEIVVVKVIGGVLRLLRKTEDVANPRKSFQAIVLWRSQ